MERQVWAQPVEYTVAASSCMHDAVHELGRELHPLLAEVQQAPASDVVDPNEHAPDSMEFASPLYRVLGVSHEVGVDISGVVAGNVEPFLTAMFEIADELGKQLTAGMFAHIADVSNAHGQTIQVSEGGFAEAFIASLESMELPFNKDGSPASSLYVNPATYAGITEPTPEQQARIDEIMDRKREAYFAARRRQDLP